MSVAKIHKIGSYVGTMQELAEIPGIRVPSMCKRIKKFYAGKSTVEQCFEEKSPPKDIEDVGNDEWNSLSRFEKDSRLQLSDVPNSFAEWEA